MERMLLQLATEQQSAGYRVSVLAIRGGALEREAADRSLRFRVLSGGRIRRALQALKHFLAERPDIVHVHNPTSLQYAALSKLVAPSKIVVTLHGDHDTHARLGSALEWWLTSATVIVSHAAGRTLQLPRQAGKFTVVHNGIAPAESSARDRASVRAELAAGNRLVGIMVARIDGRKGHLTLIEAAKTLAAQHANVALWVVGDGGRRHEVEARAAAHGLGEMMSFLGRRSDIDRLLEGADLFLLPSDIEGLPLSVLEAMSHGLPVIASNIGGIPEIITDGKEGFLVSAGDASALAAAIQKISSDAVLRETMGKAARARTESSFSLSTMVSNYERVYRSTRNGSVQ